MKRKSTKQTMKKAKQPKLKDLTAKPAKSAKAEKGKKGPKKTKGSGARLPGEGGTARSTSPLAGKVWALEVKRERLAPSPTNPRKEFPEAMLEERAASFRRLGQLTPLIVRPCPECLVKRLASLRKREAHQLEKWEARELAVVEVLAGQQVLAGTAPSDAEILEALSAAWMEFEIIAGECRWRASGPEYAGLPALKCEARMLSDADAEEFQWAENWQRTDLSPLEEAEGLARLRAKGLSVREICERLGMSESVVFERLKLVKLSTPVRAAVVSGRINMSVAAAIATVPDKAAQKEILEGIVFEAGTEEARPVRDIQADIEENFMRPLLWWDLKDSFDHEHVVSLTCAECPKMTRNMTEENSALAKGPARCLGLKCFDLRFKCASDRVRNKCASQGMVFANLEQWQQMRFQHEFCFEGETNYSGGKNGQKKWEAIAATSRVYGLAMTNSGVIRFWKRAHLIEEGLLEKPLVYSSGGAAKSPAAKRKELEAAAAAKAVTAALVGKAESADLVSPEVWRLLTHAFLGSGWSDMVREMARRRGVKDKESLRAPDFVKELTAAQCLGILVEGLCCCGMRGEWQVDKFRKQALAIFALDADAVRAEAIAALPKPKGKPLPAEAH